MPTVYEDLGQVKLRMALKDGGNGTAVASPTAVNSVTVTRYHVDFKRSDGRNTPGVDVPTGFDGAATGTIGSDGSVLTFVLVRAQAKLESPLKALRNGGGAIVISTMAEVTFYGTDQNGNTVSVTGIDLGELRGLGRPVVVLEVGVGGRPPGTARRRCQDKART